MNQHILNQEEIGNRLALVRKQKQLSQAEVADMLSLPRTSLVQLELGRRTLSAIELVKLSKIMHFSIDEFVKPDFTLTALPTQNTEIETPYLRISEPNLNPGKMQNTLLFIFERCAGKPNITENALHLLLYFIDFNHYELYEHQFTGAEYRKINNAPVAMKIDTLLQKMLDKKQIAAIKIKKNNSIQRRFIPLQKPDLTALKASETAIINSVLEQLCNFNENALLKYTQNDLPVKATSEGEPINYELVFYREEPYCLT